MLMAGFGKVAPSIRTTWTEAPEPPLLLDHLTRSLGVHSLQDGSTPKTATSIHARAILAGTRVSDSTGHLYDYHFTSSNPDHIEAFLRCVHPQPQQKMEVTRCGIHGFHETLGIDVDELRFWWILTAQGEHTVQSAYQVILTTSRNAAEASETPAAQVVWSTGKVQSDAQRDVLCKPEGGFRSTCNYFWKVLVWDQDGQCSHSPIQHFFTAYPRSRLLPPLSMNQTYMPHTALIFRTWFENIEDKWKPWWIGDGGDKPLYLRRSFTLEEKPAQVIVFASGLGHFNFSVNGASPSNHRLDPGWTNYHRRVQFVAYDLTTQISQGENVVGAHVGNGFYAGDKGDRFFWPMYEDNTCMPLSPIPSPTHQSSPALRCALRERALLLCRSPRPLRRRPPRCHHLRQHMARTQERHHAGQYLRFRNTRPKALPGGLGCSRVR